MRRRVCGARSCWPRSAPHPHSRRRRRPYSRRYSRQRQSPPSATPARGALRADTLWSQSLGTRKRVLIYLPPAYAARQRAPLPRAATTCTASPATKTTGCARRASTRSMDSLIAAGAARRSWSCPTATTPGTPPGTRCPTSPPAGATRARARTGRELLRAVAALRRLHRARPRGLGRLAPSAPTPRRRIAASPASAWAATARSRSRCATPTCSPPPPATRRARAGTAGAAARRIRGVAAHARVGPHARGAAPAPPARATAGSRAPSAATPSAGTRVIRRGSPRAS